VISRFLVPSVGTPSGPKIAPPKARLLTSIDALAILEEKEQKKQQEAEEKEQRKKEREAKRLEKQEECKRKAAERARKAEERAKEKTRKAEEKARKAEEKTRKAKEKAQKTNTSSARPGVRLKNERPMKVLIRKLLHHLRKEHVQQSKRSLIRTCAAYVSRHSKKMP